MMLDQREMEILQDAEFLPMKARVCEKVEEGLRQIWDRYKSEVNRRPGARQHEVFRSTGKMSRGENYRRQAYRVLDFPSVLTKDDMFLFRTMMLWGDAFSWHFILAGKFLEEYGELILSNMSQVAPGAFYARHSDPWLWHRSDENWVPLEGLSMDSLREMGRQRRFLKLSHFMDLKDIGQLEERSLGILRPYLEILVDG